MNDVRSHQQDHDSGQHGPNTLEGERAETASRQVAPIGKKQPEQEKAELERQRLELDVTEARYRQAELPQKEKHERDKEKLELEKLKQEILDKKLLNEHKQTMDRLEIRKAELELEEKQLATKRTTIFWDIVKYGVAILPIIATLIGLYLTYQKDTAAFRHQLELEQKFSVDDRVLTLIKNLSNTKNPIEAANAALALPAYGRAATRIIIRHLKLHTDWSSAFLIAALSDVLANEPDKSKKRDIADEIVQTIAYETDVTIKDLLLAPTADAKRASVKVHLDALTHIHDQCATACDALRIALKTRADRIGALLGKLETKTKDLDTELLGSVKQVKTMLASLQTTQVRTRP